MATVKIDLLGTDLFKEFSSIFRDMCKDERIDAIIREEYSQKVFNLLESNGYLSE